MKGELYDFSNRQRGAVRDHESVFGLGNVLTGRGNIRDSRLNAQHIASSLLGDTDGELADALHAAARAAAKPTVDEALALPAPDIAHRERIEQKIASRHKAIGYQDYASWMHSHPELKTT